MTTLESPKKASDWLSVIVTLLAMVWTIVVSGVVQLGAAVIAASPGEFSIPPNLHLPQIMLIAALIQAIALLVPLVPLALLWRAVRYRAAFRASFAATIFLILLAPVRLVPTTYVQLALVAQAALALIFSLALWALTGRGKVIERATPTAVAFAITLGILLALPWMAWGALGSIGDVLLGIVNALAFALAVTLVITRVWLRGMAQDSRGAAWDTALGGFVIGTLLVVMGSASGFTGTQFLFMLALSALGWLLMETVQINFRATNGWNDRALFFMIALGIGAPLLFLDPKAGILEASIGAGEILSVAFNATAFVVLGAWIIGLVVLALLRRLVPWQDARLVRMAALAVSTIGMAVYFLIGQPGFFGDRLFVILKDQADVSSATKIGDYAARRAFVYTTLTQHAQTTQRDLRATLDQLHIAYTSYYLVNALEVSADFPIQWWLGGRSDVDRILPSPHLRPLPQQPPTARGERTDAPQSPDWNLTLIGADRVWQQLHVRGAGVVVGQSDSGVEGTHPELAAQYRGHDGSNDYNWLDPWNHSTSPQDVGGHGTHTLGSILGKNVGVAPDATWIACVNLARNLGNPPAYLDCMQFNLAPFPQNGDSERDGDPKRGAMVLNNSWGCPDVEGCDPNALFAAVRALRDAGVFVVASAGNDGPACATIADPPSLYGDVFSVGAINRNKKLATFSSRGPVTSDGSGRIKPDIAAPGEDVLSSFPGNTYAIESGTSMAGPHIVGVVALMWSANPKLIGNIDKTEQILRETAQPANNASEKIVCGDPNATPNDFVGYGIVDAYAAVKRASVGN